MVAFWGHAQERGNMFHWTESLVGDGCSQARASQQRAGSKWLCKVGIKGGRQKRSLWESSNVVLGKVASDQKQDVQTWFVLIPKLSTAMRPWEKA